MLFVALTALALLSGASAVRDSQLPIGAGIHAQALGSPSTGGHLLNVV